ncbi:MAG: DUF5309 family protein [Clostridia bacterium]
MPTNVRASVDTFGVNSDEIIREVSKLYLAKPNQYSLVSLVHSQGMEFQKEPDRVNVSGTPIGAEIVYNPKFEQHIDEIESDEVTVNYSAGYNSSATSIVVSDGALVPKYAMIYIPRTGEIIRVSSVSSNTLTVTRGESGTTAAALVHGDTFVIQSPSYAENSLSGDVRFPQTAFTYNYTQIIREPYGESRTSQGTKYYNNAQGYDRRKAAALVSMLRKWNGTLWNGGRSIDTTNKFRNMGGVLEFIDAGNVMDVNQNLTRADFNYFCRKYAFAYNNNRKTLFAGSRLLEKVDGWAEEKNILNDKNVLNEFGLAVTSYRTRYGILDLVWEPYFDKMTVGTTPLNTYGVVLDLSLLKIKYLSSGVLKANDDIQENDRDGRKGEWLMEAGLAVNVQKAHAIIRGV